MPLPTPNPDHLPWYMWVLGVAMGLAGWLSGKMMSRLWKQTDDTSASLGEQINSVHDKLADHGARIAVLEARRPVTMEDLRTIVEQALDRVEKRFGDQHKGLADTFAEAIQKSREETEDLVSACNKALRDDIELLVKTLPETLGKLFDNRAIGRRRTRKK